MICKQVVRPKHGSTIEKDYAHELHLLSSLRCLKHPNIVKLITAYTKGPTYNFLLPVADSDLKSLLLSNSRLPGFQTDDQIFNSLWGLSSALEAVHEYFENEFNVRQIGCHYDIKPRNILCYQGRFVLSDFGLSKLIPEDDDSRSLFEQGEGCYLAPECEPSDQDFKPGLIGRSSDIWSLGCVLAEIFAYLSGGPGGGPKMVAYFYEKRKIKLGPSICHHFHGVNDINPEVTNFLDRFSTQLAHEERFKSLACVVKASLQFEPDKRSKVSKISQRLFHLAQRHLLEKACSTLEYCIRPRNLELQIELQRLRIWGDAFGLATDWEHMPYHDWWAKPRSQKEYQSTQDILQRCQVEVDFVAEQLAQDSTPPYPLSYNLQKLLDQLWNMQSSGVHRDMLSRLEEVMLQHYSTATQNDLQLAVEEGGGSAFNYRHIASLVTMKEVTSALIQRNSSDMDLSVDQSVLRLPVAELHHHSIKTDETTGKRMLIEYMEYETSWASRTDELLKRVNAIAFLRRHGRINEIFPVLKCIGFYHDAVRSQFGIVYEFPLLAKNTDPQTLAQAVNDTQSRTKQPSLTEKFKLASNLVSYILDFHRAGWLHKSICSFNIIYFNNAFDSLEESFRYPFFIGFNHSRLNDENAFSTLSGPQEEYQHPVYRRNIIKYTDDSQSPNSRFRQEFDYYSAGLVLLEIALWKDLKGILQSIRGTPEKVHEHLLKTHIKIVKSYMGELYGEAVRHCLSCYSDDKSNPEEVRSNFSKKVVIPISQCLL